MNKIFVTGTARGGTSVVCNMIAANDRANMAISPYLEVFRLYRNAILSKGDNKFDINYFKNAPFSDYYFSNSAIKTLDKILNFNSDIKISKNFWKIHEKNIKKRLSIQNKDLMQDVKKIYANKISKIFNNCFDLIVKKRKLKNKKIVGILDHWIIELFKPLANLYDDAKFIVIVKDPRASMISNLNIKKKNWVANCMSFVRNWRKMIDLTCYYKSLDLFRGRLYVLKFEKIAENPEKECKKICKFLKIPFQKKMLNTKLYKDYATGKFWSGNSSFSKEALGFSKSRNNRWKTIITKSQLNSVNYIAYQQIKISGYVTKKLNNSKDPIKELDFFIKEYNKKRNWKTDSGKIELDIGSEILKNILVNKNNKSISINKNTIRRLFLFENSYRYFLKRKKFFN